MLANPCHGRAILLRLESNKFRRTADLQVKDDNWVRKSVKWKNGEKDLRRHKKVIQPSTPVTA